jgi:integrase
MLSSLSGIAARLAIRLKRRPASGRCFRIFAPCAGDRATEFKQRCDGLGISGVSLHSYRYAWAKRALKCEFPDRFAQEALGHNSKALHRAYAKHAEVTVPSLADWETDWQKSLQHNPQSKMQSMGFRAPLIGTVA